MFKHLFFRLFNIALIGLALLAVERTASAVGDSPTLESIGGLSNTPRFTVRFSAPNQPVLFFRSHNGVTIDNFTPIGVTTDANGFADFFLAWPVPSDGSWVTTASILGFRTNTINFNNVALNPTLTINGGQFLSKTPVYSIGNVNTASATITWTTTFNGQPVIRNSAFTSDANGNGTFSGPAWGSSDLGFWNMQVTSNGRMSNTLSFQVFQTQAQSVPALPILAEIALALGLGAFGGWKILQGGALRRGRNLAANP